MAKKPNTALTDNFNRSVSTPVFFDPREKNFIKGIRNLKEKNPQLVVVDETTNQLKELFFLRNPSYRFKKESQTDFQSFQEKLLEGKKIWEIGRWVYYPWLNYLVHFLDEDCHQEQRTSRNVYLITREEQRKFYQAKIGVLGSSIGSHAALTIALTGGARCLKLADPDEISASNLNRIRSPFYTIGLNKAVAVARQIYEINPYAKITVIREGLTEKNLKKILLKPRLDLIIEEMDNLYLKIKIRELARETRIPVIMGTDNGDNIIIDAERYDLNPHYPIFHGRLGELKADDLKNISPAELPKITARIAGAEIATLKMIKSVAEVGKTIYSWPQLGNAATLCGGVLAYVARKIILGEKIKEGRTEFNVDGLLGSLRADDAIQRERLLKKLFAQK